MTGRPPGNRLLLWCLVAVFGVGAVGLAVVAAADGDDRTPPASAVDDEPLRAPSTTVALSEDELWEIEEGCGGWIEWDEFAGSGRDTYEAVAAEAGVCVRAAVAEHGASVREYFGAEMVYAECAWFEAYAWIELSDEDDVGRLREARPLRDDCVRELAPVLGEDPDAVIEELGGGDDPLAECIDEHADDAGAFRCIEEAWFLDVDEDGRIGDEPVPSTVRECLSHRDPLTGSHDAGNCVSTFLRVDVQAEIQCLMASGGVDLSVRADSAPTDVYAAWREFTAFAPCYREVLLDADPTATDLSDRDLLLMLEAEFTPWPCLAPYVDAPPAGPELTPVTVEVLRCIEAEETGEPIDLDGDGRIGPP